MAAAARSLRAGGERAGRVRRRRRARALDQARRERGGGGVDGGVPDPRVPRGHMSHPTARQLRPMDHFDGLSDEELVPWAEAAELRSVPAGAPVAEQGKPHVAFHLLLEGVLEAVTVDEQGRAEPVSEHVAPTWV